MAETDLKWQSFLLTDELKKILISSFAFQKGTKIIYNELPCYNASVTIEIACLSELLQCYTVSTFIIKYRLGAY